jgi:hypothetical protein
MKKKILSREEMIEILIEEACERDAHDDNFTLRDVLYSGFEGYDNYTDSQLEAQVGGIDEDSLEEYKEIVKQRAEYHKKVMKDISKHS